jgi:hypothetical protein
MQSIGRMKHVSKFEFWMPAFANDHEKNCKTMFLFERKNLIKEDTLKLITLFHLEHNVSGVVN